MSAQPGVRYLRGLIAADAKELCIAQQRLRNRSCATTPDKAKPVSLVRPHREYSST